MEFEGTTIEELKHYLVEEMHGEDEWYKGGTGEALCNIADRLHEAGVSVELIHSTIEGVVSNIRNEYGG